MDYKRPLLIITLLGTLGTGQYSAHAQNTQEELPDILRNLQGEGIEVRLLTEDKAAQIRGVPPPDYNKNKILRQSGRSMIYNSTPHNVRQYRTPEHK